MKKTLAYIENNLGSLIGYIESSLSELAAVGVETVPALWRRHVDHLLSLYREEQQQGPVAVMSRTSGDPVWQELTRIDRRTAERTVLALAMPDREYAIWPVSSSGAAVDPDWLDSFEEVRCDDCRGTGETPVNEPDHVCQCAGTGHMFRCPSCGHDHCPADGSPPLQCDRCSAVNEAEVWNRSEADDDLPACGYCGRAGHDEETSACPKRRQDATKHVTGGQSRYPREIADRLTGTRKQEAEHTTETWTAFQNPEDIGSNYWRIRVADGLKDSLHGYCGERRARLIAAAPDLLEALEYILGDSVSFLRDTAIEKARAAIAKAEGKEDA